MNFFQLECFVMAVEKESFAEVAASMHVTQPTITYQITNLEEELEEKLFQRTKRGVEATRAGLLFYEGAQDILQHYHEALRSFKHALSPQQQVIRVGFTRFPDNYDIFLAIHRFRSEYPDTVVDVVQDRILSDGTEADEEQFDVLLHYCYRDGGFPNYEYYPLGHCPFYVLLSQYSPLAMRDELSFEDLKGYKLLTSEEYKNSVFQVPSLRKLKNEGIEVGFYENMDQLVYAVADGAGFGIYPAKYQTVQAGFKRVLFSSLPPLEYGLLFRAEHSDAVETFLQYLISVLRDEHE